jgi:hypothetical protein
MEESINREIQKTNIEIKDYALNAFSRYQKNVFYLPAMWHLCGHSSLKSWFGIRAASNNINHCLADTSPRLEAVKYC